MRTRCMWGPDISLPCLPCAYNSVQSTYKRGFLGLHDSGCTEMTVIQSVYTRCTEMTLLECTFDELRLLCNQTISVCCQRFLQLAHGGCCLGMLRVLISRFGSFCCTCMIMLTLTASQQVLACLQGCSVLQQLLFSCVQPNLLAESSIRLPVFWRLC